MCFYNTAFKNEGGGIRTPEPTKGLDNSYGISSTFVSSLNNLSPARLTRLRYPLNKLIIKHKNLSLYKNIANYNFINLI